MWRSIFAVIVMPSMLWAQEQNLNPDKFQDRKNTLRQDYLVLTEWQTMKRGTTEKAVIRFSLAPGYVVSPYEPARDLVPLKLEFSEADGVAATSFRFDVDQRVHFKFREESARKEQMLQPPDDRAYAISGDKRDLHSPPAEYSQIIERARVRVLNPSFQVAIKLKASKKATLGAHLLHGKITYQLILDDGALPPQEMEVALPVTVVDKDTITFQNPEYQQRYGWGSAASPGIGSGSKGEKVALILLAPLIVPLVFLELIVCGIRGQDCRC